MVEPNHTHGGHGGTQSYTPMKLHIVFSEEKLRGGFLTMNRLLELGFFHFFGELLSYSEAH